MSIRDDLIAAKAPELPTEISGNGKEVWDWAAKFSEHVHRVAKIRELNAQILRVGRRCGDCDKWMKSRSCPRERNVGGFSRGPSCEGFICEQFVEAAAASKRRMNLAEQLRAIAGDA